MLAYPTENNKGKFIAIFWSIFNLGGVVGAAVSLGQNYDSSVSTAKAPWETAIGYLNVEILAFFCREIRVCLCLPWRPSISPIGEMVLLIISSLCLPSLPSFVRPVTRGTYVSDRQDQAPGPETPGGSFATC